MTKLNKIDIPQSVLELFLPEKTLEWFDLTDGKKENNEIYLTLVEKNNPPLPVWYKDEKIESKGFRDITVTDFPLRGRSVHLIFRRRTWEIEGSPTRLKRDIKLVAEGTLLEKEFAGFLKESG